MESKINNTLLEKLFINPEPLKRKRHLFQALHSRMFPCKSAFRSFLSTVDGSEQHEHAKYIIQRLCFEANYPPAYVFLSNLYDFEKDTVNRSTSSTYIPQDHFSHIVYSYLLGIYIFFYMPSINQALTKEFIGKRQEKSYNLALDAAKDFLSYWKSFCLFHDIAYPIERLCAPSNSPDNEKRYIECFNNIDLCLSKEVLAECASKFIVLWQLLNDDENNILFSQAAITSTALHMNWESDDGSSISSEDLLSSYGGWKTLDKIHSYEHFKMLTGFLSGKNYLVVLFDALNEQPIAIKIISNATTMFYYLCSNNNSLENSVSKDYLNNCETELPSNYYIRFFLQIDSSIKDSLLLNYGAGKFTKEQYNLLVSKVIAIFDTQPEPSVSFSQITTSEELSNYIFQTYRTVLLFINSNLSQGEIFPKHPTGLKTEISKKQIIQFFKDNFIEYYKITVLGTLPIETLEAAKEKLVDSASISDSAITSIIRDSINLLFDTKTIEKYKKGMVSSFTTDFRSAINREKENIGILVQFLTQCNNLVQPSKLVRYEYFNPSNVKVGDIYSLLQGDNTAKDILNNLTEDLNQRMNKLTGSPTYHTDEWITKYKTEYITYDHGIIASLIYLLSVKYYRSAIEHLFNSRNGVIATTLSTLCWNVDYDKYVQKLQNNYDHVFQSVLKSIFYHNLYPSDIAKIFGGNQSVWNYSISKEPSIYFAMMIDFLQVWNRNKYYWTSTMNWWPDYSSDNVDIRINNNKIILKLVNYKNDLTALENKFHRSAETYLKDFSTFVKLDVSQSQ